MPIGVDAPRQFTLRGAKIRLEDVNAPEKSQPKCTSEGILAADATRRLMDLLNSGEFRVVKRGKRDEDRYGRKLRTIEINGRSIGDILISEGLARRWEGRRGSWCD